MEQGALALSTRNLIVWIKRHWAFSALCFVLTIYGAITDFRDIITDIANNLNEIVSAPDHLWLRWLFILAGLGLSGWGAYRSSASKQSIDNAVQSALEDQKSVILKDVIQKLDDATKLPALQAKKVLTQCRLDRIQQAKQLANESSNLYTTFIANARSGELADKRATQITAQIQSSLSPLNDAKMLLANADGSITLPDLQLEECQPVVVGGMTPIEGPRFDAGRNTNFFDALDRNNAKISKFVVAVDAMVAEKNSELNGIENDLMAEAKRLTNG
jgi:hypothetical protein